MAKNLSKLTKLQLEKHGRTLGIELDRRLKKADILKQIKEFETAPKTLASIKTKPKNVKKIAKKKVVKKAKKKVVKKAKEEDSGIHIIPEVIMDFTPITEVKEVPEVKEVEVKEPIIEIKNTEEVQDTFSKNIASSITKDKNSFNNKYIVYVTKDADVNIIAEKLDKEAGISVLSKMPKLFAIGIASKDKDIVLNAVKKTSYSNKVRKVIKDIEISLQEVKKDFKKTTADTILSGPTGNTSGFQSRNWDRVHFRHLERITSLQQPEASDPVNSISSPTVTTGTRTISYNNNLPGDWHQSVYMFNRNATPKIRDRFHTIVQRIDFSGINIYYTDSNGNRVNTKLRDVQHDVEMEYTITGTFTAPHGVAPNFEYAIQLVYETDGKSYYPVDWENKVSPEALYERGVTFPSIDTFPTEWSAPTNSVSTPLDKTIRSKGTYINIKLPNLYDFTCDFEITAQVVSKKTISNINSVLYSSDNSEIGLTRNAESKTNYKGQYSSGTGNITGKGVDIYVIDTGVAGASAGISGAKTQTTHSTPINISKPHRAFLNENFDPTSSLTYSERYTQIQGDNINEEIDSQYRVFSLSKVLADRGITPAAGTSGLGAWFDEDTIHHGTTVAQCAAGYGPGLAIDSRVYSSKVFDSAGSGTQTTSYLIILNGIQDIISHHEEKIAAGGNTRPSIINMSIGLNILDPETIARNNLPFRDIIFLNDVSDDLDSGAFGFFDDSHSALLEAGIHVCFAAGNSTFNTDFLDGARTGAKSRNSENTVEANISISASNTEGLDQTKYVVGATEYTQAGDRVSKFSNYGAGINIWAPGTDIVHYSWISDIANVSDADIRVASSLDSLDYGTSYAHFFPFTPIKNDQEAINVNSGTSFSSPIVAGTIAQYLQEFPYGPNNAGGTTKTELEQSVQDTFNFMMTVGVSPSTSLDTGDWFDLPQGNDAWIEAAKDIAFSGLTVVKRVPNLIDPSTWANNYISARRTGTEGAISTFTIAAIGQSANKYIIIPEGMTLESGDWIAIQSDPNLGKYKPNALNVNQIFNRNNSARAEQWWNKPIKIAETNGKFALLDMLDYGPDGGGTNPPPIIKNLKICKLNGTHAIRYDKRIAYNDIVINRNSVSDTDGYYYMLTTATGTTYNYVRDYFPANTINKNYLFSPVTETKIPVTWASNVKTFIDRNDTIDMYMGINETELTLWNDQVASIDSYQFRSVSSPDSNNNLPAGLSFDIATQRITGTIANTAAYGDYTFDIIVWPTYSYRRYTLSLTQPNVLVPEILSWTTNLINKTLTINLNGEVLPNATDPNKLTIISPIKTHTLSNISAVTINNNLTNSIIYNLNDQAITSISDLINTIPNSDCGTQTPSGLKLHAAEGYAENSLNSSIKSKTISVANALPVSNATLPSDFLLNSWSVNLTSAQATFNFSHSIDENRTSPTDLEFVNNSNSVVRTAVSNDLIYSSTDSMLIYNTTTTAGITDNTPLDLSSTGISGTNPTFKIADEVTHSFLLATGITAVNIKNTVANYFGTRNALDAIYPAGWKGSDFDSPWGSSQNAAIATPYFYLTDGRRLKFKAVNGSSHQIYTSAPGFNFDQFTTNEIITISSTTPPGLLLPGTGLGISVGDFVQTSIGTLASTGTDGNNRQAVIKIFEEDNNTTIQLSDYTGYTTNDTEIYYNVTTAGKDVTFNLDTELNNILRSAYRISENKNDIALNFNGGFVYNKCDVLLDTTQITTPLAPIEVIIDEEVIPPSPELISWEFDGLGKKLKLCYSQSVDFNTLDLSSKEMILTGSNGSIRLIGTGVSSTDNNCVEVTFPDIFIDDIAAVVTEPTDTNLRLRAVAGHISGTNNQLALAFGDTTGTFIHPLDTTLPILNTWDLDLDAKILSLFFSKQVNASTLDVSNLTIIKNYSLTLNSGDITTALADTAIHITLDSTTTNDLIRLTGNNGNNIRISAPANWIYDNVSISNAASARTPLAVSNFTPASLDTTPPTLNKWTLNITNNTLASAVFTADKLLSLADVTSFTITIEGTDINIDSTNTVTVIGSQINITFSSSQAGDLFDALDISTGGAVNTTTADITLTSTIAWATDSVVIPNTSGDITVGINPITLNAPSDTISPTLVSWDLDLELDRVTLIFNEPVQSSSLIFTSITIKGYTLTGGSLITTDDTNIVVFSLNTTDADMLLATTGNII